MAKATLVVMAAGMGSRFGGMKQLEPVGANREVLLDYSVYDAKRAGFDKVVFVIKRSIESDFKALVGDRISRNIDVEYVYQDIPQHRKKPYGTGDAILCTASAVDSPFAVINADDFYGADSFRKIYEGLQAKNEYCMVGYNLFNTLSDNGTVSRGVCDIRDGYLADVTEHGDIGSDTTLPKETVVSMNMWGLQPDIFSELEIKFAEFLSSADITKDEFQIPRVIDSMIKSGKKQVRVYETSAVWHGMTYREDKEKVVKAISDMTSRGEYPEKLWN